MAANAAMVFELSAVPDFRSAELADGALKLVKQLFSLPGVEEEYQSWLAKRNHKKGDE